MLKRVRRHKFGDTWYEIDIYEPYIASCDPPEGRTPTITSPAGVKDDRSTLIWLLHEAIHASNFYGISEENVDKISAEAG